MSDPITYGGVAVTVFLVVLSLRAEKWWPPFYVSAVLFGFSTLYLAWSWPENLRDLCWSVWLVYAFALPIFRVELARRVRRAERLAGNLAFLRDAFSVDSDEKRIYARNVNGEIIATMERDKGMWEPRS